MKDFTEKLVSLVGEKKANEIKRAIKKDIPILIKGPQGPTGKTYLRKLINENGGVAVEEKLCYEITLDKPYCVCNFGNKNSPALPLQTMQARL